MLTLDDDYVEVYPEKRSFVIEEMLLICWFPRSHMPHTFKRMMMMRRPKFFSLIMVLFIVIVIKACYADVLISL